MHRQQQDAEKRTHTHCIASLRVRLLAQALSGRCFSMLAVVVVVVVVSTARVHTSERGRSIKIKMEIAPVSILSRSLGRALPSPLLHADALISCAQMQAHARAHRIDSFASKP